MKMTALTFEEAFETEVRPVIERVEEKTGEDFMSLYQPIRGEFVSEFTDIRWVAVQMLAYWANDTGTDFQTCAREFMKSFQRELQDCKEQSWPAPEDPQTNCPCNSGKPYGACGADCGLLGSMPILG